MQRSAVLKSAGVDLGELKTFFRQQKRRSSCVGLGVLHSGPLLPPSPAAPAAEQPLAPLVECASASDEWADASAGTTVCVPMAPSSPHVAAAAGLCVAPATSLDGKAAAAAAAFPCENESPNIATVGAVHARDASDESMGTSGGSSNKKSRRRRRQSFNLSELDQRLREIAESGASPCPPMHGMPSPMIPMTTPTTPRATPALGAGAHEVDSDTPVQPRMLAAESPFARATPSAGSGWRAAELAMAVDDDDDIDYAPAELAPFEPPSEPRAAVTPRVGPLPSPAAAPATPDPSSAFSPCVDLARARTHAPLSTCAHVVGHIRAAARTARLGCAAAVDALGAVVREVSTFAELWHWDEETRLAVRAADDECKRPRAARVRFSAMDAASLEPPAWSDDSCEVQRAALDAMLPVMRACSELPALLAAVPAAKLRRFLQAAAAAVGADPTLRPSGAGAFWREQLCGLARGELLYGARCGALVRSLVRHELRALAARNEAGEADALRTMPSPRAGPVLHADADSVARVLSNALRVWEGCRETTVDPVVIAAFAAAAHVPPSPERSGADVVRELLPSDALAELLRAADAHTALSHLVMGCAFVRAASVDEGGPLRQLLELAPLVPGWIDEFAQLVDLAQLDRELAHARAICRSARDLFPHGAIQVAAPSD